MIILTGFLLGVVGFIFGYYVIGPIVSKVINFINRLGK